MRGTVREEGAIKFRDRITPAHAGNSGGVNYRIAGFEDHPRTCGEQPTGMPLRSRPKGSPPHMRGTDTVGDGGRCDGGITPAHAGNSKRNAKRKLFS